MTNNHQNNTQNTNPNSKWTIYHYGYLIFLALIFYIFFLLYVTSDYDYNKDIISYLLLASLIIVLFLPLVKEIDILNIIKIKKDLDEFRKDICDKVSQIQNTVLTSITDINNRNINTVVFSDLANIIDKKVEEKLSEIEVMKLREDKPLKIEKIKSESKKDEDKQNG